MTYFNCLICQQSPCTCIKYWTSGTYFRSVCPKCGGYGTHYDQETAKTVRCDCGAADLLKQITPYPMDKFPKEALVATLYGEVVELIDLEGGYVFSRCLDQCPQCESGDFDLWGSDEFVPLTEAAQEFLAVAGGEK